MRARFTYFATALIAFALVCGPARGQSSKAQTAKKNTDNAQSAKAAKPGSVELVDLNTASEKELEKLPGVTPEIAQRIIFNRPFKSVADLKRAGIPVETEQNITPLVTVKAAPETSGSADRSADKVWVNPDNMTYCYKGDDWYGKTKHGKYMTEAEARKAGYIASHK